MTRQQQKIVDTKKSPVIQKILLVKKKTIDLKNKTQDRDRQLVNLESAPLNHIISEDRCTELLSLLNYNLNILH